MVSTTSSTTESPTVTTSTTSSNSNSFDNAMIWVLIVVAAFFIPILTYYNAKYCCKRKANGGKYKESKRYKKLNKYDGEMTESLLTERKQKIDMNDDEDSVIQIRVVSKHDKIFNLGFLSKDNILANQVWEDDILKEMETDQSENVKGGNEKKNNIENKENKENEANKKENNIFNYGYREEKNNSNENQGKNYFVEQGIVYTKLNDNNNYNYKNHHRYDEKSDAEYSQHEGENEGVDSRVRGAGGGGVRHHDRGSLMSFTSNISEGGTRNYVDEEKDGKKQRKKDVYHYNKFNRGKGKGKGKGKPQRYGNMNDWSSTNDQDNYSHYGNKIYSSDNDDADSQIITIGAGLSARHKRDTTSVNVYDSDLEEELETMG